MELLDIITCFHPSASTAAMLPRVRCIWWTSDGVQLVTPAAYSSKAALSFTLPAFPLSAGLSFEAQLSAM
ncbi:hypothetical protein BST61_g8758 [Cercospora zeina]